MVCTRFSAGGEAARPCTALHCWICHLPDHPAVVPRLVPPIPPRGRNGQLLVLLGPHSIGRNRAVRSPRLVADVAAAVWTGLPLVQMGVHRYFHRAEANDKDARSEHFPRRCAVRPRDVEGGCVRVLTDVLHGAVMWNAIDLYHAVRDFTTAPCPSPQRKYASPFTNW